MTYRPPGYPSMLASYELSEEFLAVILSLLLSHQILQGHNFICINPTNFVFSQQ